MNAQTNSVDETNGTDTATVDKLMDDSAPKWYQKRSFQKHIKIGVASGLFGAILGAVIMWGILLDEWESDCNNKSNSNRSCRYRRCVRMKLGLIIIIAVLLLSTFDKNSRWRRNRSRRSDRKRS